MTICCDVASDCFLFFIHIPNLITSAILLSTIPSKLLYSQNNKNFVR